MSQASNVHLFEGPDGRKSEGEIPNFWQRWFSPQRGTQTVTSQSNGIFLPYPLLAAFVAVCLFVLGGIIVLEIQVSNLNNTLLSRDADQRAAIHDMKDAEHRALEDVKDQLAKETERRELTDLKVGDLREKQQRRN